MSCQLSRYFLVGHGIFCLLSFLLLVVVVLSYVLSDFLVLNCLTISLPVPILLNTSSLVIFSVHDIFSTLRYTLISKAASLDNRDLIIVHVSILSASNYKSRICDNRFDHDMICNVQ